MGNAAATGIGLEAAPNTLEESVSGIVSVVSSYHPEIHNMRQHHRILQLTPCRLIHLPERRHLASSCHSIEIPFRGEL